MKNYYVPLKTGIMELLPKLVLATICLLRELYCINTCPDVCHLEDELGLTYCCKQCHTVSEERKSPENSTLYQKKINEKIKTHFSV